MWKVKNFHIYFFFSIAIFPWFGEFVTGQNAPVSTISNISTYSNTATLTITATGFNNIGAADLKIIYNPAIAIATSVSAGSSLPGNLVYNILTPGEIIIGWYNVPAISMPSGAVIFNLGFSAAGFGYTSVEFDDSNGYNCSWYDANSTVMNDIPASTYYINGSVNFKNPTAPKVILPDTTSCSGSSITIPVRVTDFNDIGKFNLALQYNSNIIGYQSFTNVSGFPGLTVTLPGTGFLAISGTITGGTNGFSLPDSATLLSITFYHSAGNTSLTWFDDGASCAWYGPPPVYFSLTDVPQTNYYFNGNITGIAIPAPAGIVTGPSGGLVCRGDEQVSFSLAPVASAEFYIWNLPVGFTIDSGDSTNSIIVTAGTNAVNGIVTAAGENSCGTGTPSPPFPVFPKDSPGIVSQPVTPPAVIAGTGSASFTVGATGDSLAYQWQELNSAWINLTDGGIYSGVHTPVLTISQPPLTMNGLHYRCVVQGICPPDTTTDGQAKLVVGPYIGLDNNTFTCKISIYPNPVTEETVIRIPDLEYQFVKLKVSGIVGNDIGSFIVDKEFAGELFIPFPFKDLTNGVYILSISVNKRDIVLNWIKNILVLDR